MKRAFAMIVCLWTLFGICGCGTNPPSETGKVSVDETETAQASEHETVYAEESETIPEETRKDTAKSSPADAATSASVLVPGNTARIADEKAANDRPELAYHVEFFGYFRR